MKKLFSYFTSRQVFLFIGLGCVGLLLYALYTEHFLGLVPCPLCMTQRLFYALAGTTAFIAAVHAPGTRGSRLYSSAGIVFALGGAGFAGRQVWLQHLPADQVPACGPSLEYMFDVLPFTEALRTLMMGDGNCAEVQWTFIGLSMPEWSMICLVGIALDFLLVAVMAPHMRQRHT